ncbi:MAG: VOC family protein [Cyanobacteria bacterium P01_A01_bin.84]
MKIYLLNFFLFLFAGLANAQNAISVEKVSLTVSNLEKSVPFYANLLDFNVNASYELKGEAFRNLYGIDNVKTTARVVLLSLGNEKVELIEFIDEDRKLRIPEDSKSNDGWFQHMAIVVSNMEEAYKKLLENGVEHVSTRPQTLPEYISAAAGIKAFYFKDPDGHNLEIIFFPQGKGNPKWQGQTEKLFLGIDHTAIGIGKTSIAMPLYRDILEMNLTGSSNNFGYEQEHLNQVFGANLVISGLTAKRGISIEFLDYIAPPGGRSYPKDSQTTDLWHWHTTITVNNLDEIFTQLTSKGYPLISSGLIKTKTENLLMFRDIDGHALLLKQLKL